jgi:ankyrin repeat protein
LSDATADEEADTRPDNHNTHNNFFASPRRYNNEDRDHDKDNRELMRAVKEGQLHRVKYLINCGANVDYDADGGDTPLIQAVDYDREEIVKMLILAGADVNRMRLGCEQAIHAAMRETTDEKFAILRLLLGVGCKLDEETRFGDTPLHLAVSARFAKALIQGGANIESRKMPRSGSEDSGSTPLHEHAQEGRIEIVKILIQAGANVNARCDEGKTPLGRCLERDENRESIIAHLRAHGATE